MVRPPTRVPRTGVWTRRHAVPAPTHRRSPHDLPHRPSRHLVRHRHLARPRPRARPPAPRPRRERRGDHPLDRASPRRPRGHRHVTPARPARRPRRRGAGDAGRRRRHRPLRRDRRRREQRRVRLPRRRRGGVRRGGTRHVRRPGVRRLERAARRPARPAGPPQRPRHQRLVRARPALVPGLEPVHGGQVRRGGDHGGARGRGRGARHLRDERRARVHAHGLPAPGVRRAPGGHDRRVPGRAHDGRPAPRRDPRHPARRPREGRRRDHRRRDDGRRPAAPAARLGLARARGGQESAASPTTSRRPAPWPSRPTSRPPRSRELGPAGSPTLRGRPRRACVRRR